jgi:hypothetical protein
MQKKFNWRPVAPNVVLIRPFNEHIEGLHEELAECIIEGIGSVS